MKIGIIGYGRVGRIIGHYLSFHHEIIPLDNNPHINIEGVTTSYDDLKDVEIAFIAVPTPYDENKHTLDISVVKEVTSSLLSVNNHVLIYIKSTMPIGGTRKIINSLNYHNIFYTPEFFKENSNIGTFLDDASRLIFSSIDDNKEAGEIYFSLFDKQKNRFTLKLEEAEMAKLFSNAYLAYRINFFNEVSEVAKENGLDDSNVIKAISFDPRIGDYYNRPSLGYAGKCLPKDVKALRGYTEGRTSDIVSRIDEANEERLDSLYESLLSILNKFDKPVVGIIGEECDYLLSPFYKVLRRLKEEHDIKMIVYNYYRSNFISLGTSICSSLDELKERSTIIIDINKETYIVNK